VHQRINLVTLGVGDVQASAAFYERLGWRRSGASMQEVVFFDAGGVVLGLYGRGPLAEDAAVSAEGAGFRAVALALNLPSRAEVDATIAEAAAAGATVTKRAEEVFWGGYSGYFADPDGHLWEVAHNPLWPLAEDGRIVLPD
jgi:catechol 2,3-dioxygenase-like lactoylglutathione lyase family enzyme